MSSRITLYLERLTLDELMFLEDEIGRRKERFRKEHFVMAIQTEQRLLTTLRRETLVRIANDLRRYYNDCATSGHGILLAYSPEASLLLVKDVQGAAKIATQLFAGLAELNGRLGTGENRITLKLGLASGSDILAVGSMRSIRQSQVVRRAGQCAMKAPAGCMLIDENSRHYWIPSKDPVRIPIDIDGMPVYRVSAAGVDLHAQNPEEEHLIKFLKEIERKGIGTLKYSLLKEHSESADGHWAQSSTKVSITLEAFDPEVMKNVSISKKCSLSNYADYVERVRLLVSDLGLGLVKHEDASQISVG